MAKVTKNELRYAYDAHSYSINGFHAAVGSREKLQAVEIMARSGATLVDLLDRPMRKSPGIQELAEMGERLIESGAKLVRNHTQVAVVGNTVVVEDRPTAQIIQLSDYR